MRELILLDLEPDPAFRESLYGYLAAHAVGERRAVPRRDLCKDLACSDRLLRRAKEELVVSGIAVCAAETGGYFLAQTPGEIRGAKAQHLSYLRSHAEAIEGYEKAEKQMQERPLKLEAK